MDRIQEEISEAVAGRSWFNSLGSQNDPLDSAPVLVPADALQARKAVSVVKKAIGKNWAVAGGNLRERFSKRTRSTTAARDQYWTIQEESLRKVDYVPWGEAAISCFTTEPMNTLMWAYYSESFRSYSLEFTLQADRTFCEKVGNPLPITYCDERPRIENVEYFKWCAWLNARDRDKASRILNFSECNEIDIVKRLTCFKSKDWGHEEEWRFVVRPNKAGYYSLGKYKLTAIIFGSRIDETFRKKICDELPEEIERYQLKLADSTFALSKLKLAI